MGLDMYLSARKYLSGWNHSKAEEKAEFNKLAKDSGMSKLIASGAPSGYLEFHVAYWRKANQIHKWFVDKVQKGEDDCGKYYVEREQLQELRDLCQAILDDPKKAEEELPTQAGFFFGGTDYDEYYLADLKETVSQLDNALACPDSWEFEYHSSW
jgi:hypothetical protein